MDMINSLLAAINSVLWHTWSLYAVLTTGIVLTVWSGFSQYRAITHGTKVVRGVYDDPGDPGAINHFQALSAALSATVGLGNIGGVALAIALGGPGAVFWMWVVGLFGMAIKLTEVTLSMLYRNTNDPDNPHGGPMWVVSKGLAQMKPSLAGVGKVIGGLFCATLLISTITGGNMFQAWNVADLTETYFGIPGVATGILLAVIVGAVIIGGIKRIGRVAGSLVPFMVVMYLLAGCYVLIVNFAEIPAMLKLIVVSAFSSTDASGAFLGGTMGYAFLFGMKRALFSNEAGQGSSPIAHSAAKTNEPVREGIVAGLEPFIDTIVVCTFTSLVILSSGVWQRNAEVILDRAPTVVPVDLNVWSIEQTTLPKSEHGDVWRDGANVFVIIEGDSNENTGNKLHRLEGTVDEVSHGHFIVNWNNFGSQSKPQMTDNGIYVDYIGATLTAKAFDSAADGLGKWLVTLAAWLFAISTMIAWSYYGEQGVVYLFGERMVLTYKVIFCLLIIVATVGFIKTTDDLDNLSSFGTGIMLFVNIPIIWIFSHQAMKAYKSYINRLRTGKLGPEHAASSLEDLISGHDVEKS
ncbi:MAG: sodium:alanine symporter family protein [Gammaproteobacteria bacterium]|nr:sodium:alanine symporter family protein [Gammaproteobacteria bacterium]